MALASLESFTGGTFRINVNGMDFPSLTKCVNSNVQIASRSHFPSLESFLSGSLSIGGRAIELGVGADETVLSGVNISLANSTEIITNAIRLVDGTALTGRGGLLGSLTNEASVVADQFSIHGDYTQKPSGHLRIGIEGDVYKDGHPHLVVFGSATLDGTLSVSRPNGFVPDVWSDFVAIAAVSVSGEFGNVSGGGIDPGPSLSVDFGQSSVVLSRDFERQHETSSPYVNEAAGSRVFFDSLDVDDVPGDRYLKYLKAHCW